MKPPIKQIDDLFQKAVNLHNLKNWDQAVIYYEKILSRNPNHFDANHLMGAALYEKKEFHNALLFVNKAIEVDPQVPYTYNTLALIVSNLGDKKSAIESYKIAIKLKPDYFEALFNLGNLLNDSHEYALAIKSYDQCLKISPNYIHAYLNRGNAYKELKLYDDSLKSYDFAIKIDQNFIDAIYNKGLVLQHIGEHHQALQCYLKILSLNKDHIQAKWALSLCQLLLGDLIHGFINYEIRFNNNEISNSFTNRNLNSPIWLGDEDINEKTIYVYHEQGLGDTIQFCRYTKLLSDKGAKVILEVQKPLEDVLSNIDGISQILTTGDATPNHDYRCPLLSLPLAFKTYLGNIPKKQRYISSSPEYVDKWNAILGQKKKYRIGLVWSGNKDHKNDINRSIPLNLFSDFFNEDLEYFSLQKEVRESDKDSLEKFTAITHLGNLLSNYSDTAAVCDLMDLVISVDTSVAHLSAALGRETWLLLPFNPDWRWLLNTNESPWYPTMKLFRQPIPSDWISPLANIKLSLKNHFIKFN